MKKILTIVSGVIIAGSITVWKSIDNKVIKNADEVITKTTKNGFFTSNKSTLITKKTTEQILKNNPLQVQYFDFAYTKNGKSLIAKIPDFSENSIFKTTLPTNLQIAPDETQFMNGIQSLNKSYLNEPLSIIKKLRSENASIVARDNVIYQSKKTEILQAQEKMLEATKNLNLSEQTKWLKELRRLTNNITFIKTPKGKPFKIPNQEEILEKQIKDIINPSSLTKGRIFGYVWHHNENKGIIELISKDVHEFNKHTGGNKIWGEGVR
jgi:hypothetical protein